MRKILFLLMLTSFFLIPKIWSQSNSPQLYIEAGTKGYSTQDTYIVLDNLNLINNASPGVLSGGTLKFTGSNHSKIGGDQKPGFNAIDVAKTGLGKLILSQSINVEQKITFESGLFELNNFNVNMSPSALIVGEKEDSHFTGSNGGLISINVPLNAPSFINPGNLGAIISSGSNMGIVTIRRGHQAQSDGMFKTHPGILRHYDIIPANNTNLNATIQLQYFDAELNGNNKAMLRRFKSTNSGYTIWEDQGFTSRDDTNNFVENTGINSSSRWTLSDLQPGVAIPPSIAKADRLVPEASKAFIIQVYPTVIADGKLYIQVGNVPVQKMQARLYDAVGRLLQNQQLIYQSQWLLLPNLSTGTYRIVLQSGMLKYTGYFIKSNL